MKRRTWRCRIGWHKWVERWRAKHGTHGRGGSWQQCRDECVRPDCHEIRWVVRAADPTKMHQVPVSDRIPKAPPTSVR